MNYFLLLQSETLYDLYFNLTPSTWVHLRVLAGSVLYFFGVVFCLFILVYFVFVPCLLPNVDDVSGLFIIECPPRFALMRRRNQTDLSKNPDMCSSAMTVPIWFTAKPAVLPVRRRYKQSIIKLRKYLWMRSNLVSSI